MSNKWLLLFVDQSIVATVPLPEEDANDIIYELSVK